MLSLLAMPMMVAGHRWIVLQRSLQQCVHSRITAATHPAVELDARVSQSVLCTSADTATDQRIDVLILQQSCQSTMPGAIAAKDMRLHDFPIFQCIDFELLRLTKMLKDLAIVIGYC